MPAPGEHFVIHLDELRKRLIVSGAAFLGAAAWAFAYSGPIVDFLLKPARAEGAPLYFFSPADAFLLRMNAALAAGAVLAAPVILVQAWRFVSPGLFEREKKALAPLVLVAGALFAAGAAFAYAGVLPFGFRFLLSFGTDTLRPHLSAPSCAAFAVSTMLSFGFAFNLPVLLAGLCYAGVLRAEFLRRHRRHAAVLVFIAAAVLTPSPDIAGQLLLGVPLAALYELGIFAAGIAERLRPARAMVQ